MKKNLQADPILIWMISHLDLFWNRGTRELRKGLYYQYAKKEVLQGITLHRLLYSSW